MIGTDLTAHGFATQETIDWPGPFSMGPKTIRGCICSDGKQRSAYCSPLGADTFFSIPARVTVNGKTVAGYVTRETIDGWSTETEGDPAVWKFVAYTYRVNAGELPRGAWKSGKDALL